MWEFYLRDHLAVELAIDGAAVLVDELECVRAVAVHVAVSVRRASVREQEHYLQIRNSFKMCPMLK